MSDEFNLQPPAPWWHDLQLFGRYFKLNLMSAVEYKLGFLTIFTNIFFNLIIWLVYWSVILGTSGGSFGSWTSTELVVWYFFTEFSIGILGIFTGLYTMYYSIIEYGMEPLLSRPVHPVIHLVGDGMYVISIVRSIFSIVILGIGVYLFEIEISLWMLLFGVVISLAGILIFSAILVFLQTFAFWIGDVEFLVDVMVDIEMNFIRLPLNIVSQTMLFSLFIAIPVGLFATIPTMLTLGLSLFGQTKLYIDILLVVAILVFALIISILSIKFFNLGLKRYEGVGE